MSTGAIIAYRRHAACASPRHCLPATTSIGTGPPRSACFVAETLKRDRSADPRTVAPEGSRRRPPDGRSSGPPCSKRPSGAVLAAGTAAAAGHRRADRPRDLRPDPAPVPQPGRRRHDGAPACPGFGAAVLAFLWPTLTSGFGSKITAGTDRHPAGSSSTQAAVLQPSGPLLHQPLPDRRDHPGQGQEDLQPRPPHRHGGGLRRPVPEVRPPRLPGAVVPVPVVRVPVPRLEVQPGRREEGRPGAARSRPLRHQRRRGDRHGRHQAGHPGPRSGPTPPARARKARIARDGPGASVLAVASTQQKLGVVIVVTLLVVWVGFLLAHLKKAGPVPGSEIELAPNRKPYYDDSKARAERASAWLSSSSWRQGRPPLITAKEPGWGARIGPRLRHRVLGAPVSAGVFRR